ncbi:MAG: FAD-dependent monooxygenase [Burkholderiaceae bacterium]
MTRPLDVCVRGDGIVGHVLALLLARERLRVGLVAPAAAPGKAHSDVRAYALNRQSRELLDSLRCWPAADLATPVLAMDVRETGGGAVEFSAARQGEPALAWIVDVPALESRLADAVRFQSGIEVLDEPAPARLTAVCEGRSSETRQQYGVDWDVSDYGQWAIAARVRCAVPHGQTACQWFTPSDVLGFLPLDGEYGNSMALVWSLDKEKHGQMLALDAAAFELQLQQASASRFGALSLISERVVWPLQLATARRWLGDGAGGSWVLAGDAAHVVHPLAGQGLNLGLADAQELAHQLRSRDYWREVNDAKMLRRYERARKVDVWLMGATTDGLQRLFARPGPLWQGLRQLGMGGFDNSGIIKNWVAHRAMGRGSGKVAKIGTTQ